MFRFLILGLMRSRRMHGYALVKEYRERSGADVSSGNFYRELQRLMKDGLVRGSAGPADADARRTPYEITDAGVAAFDEWFTAQHASVEGFSEDEISARALFMADAEALVVDTLLDRLKDNLWMSGKRLERDRQRLLSQQERARGGAAAILLLLLARRQRYVAADLELIEALRCACEQRRTAAAAELGVERSDRMPVDQGRGKPLRARAEPVVHADMRAGAPARR